jgi:hypothetical protein
MTSTITPEAAMRGWTRVEYDGRAGVDVHREPAVSPDALHGWRDGSVETLRPPLTVAPLTAPARASAVAELLS